MEFSDETKRFVLKFVASLSLCDDMGEVASKIETAFHELGVDIDFEDYRDLRRKLDKMGVTTMYDNRVWSDDEE